MKKFPLYLVIFLAPFHYFAAPEQTRVLDFKEFSIIVPKSYIYKKQQGEDSFIGEIVTRKKQSIVFDFSTHGYANPLLPTIDQYLESEEWMPSCPFCVPGISYTLAEHVQITKEREMKEKGIKDSSQIKVEPFINPKKHIDIATAEHKTKYPNADYIGTLTHKDSSITVPISIPEAVKLHHISIDSTAQYYIKTIYPKTIGNGMTGIYIRGRNNGLTFNMAALNLDEQEQKELLKAFSSIKIKEL